MKLLSGEENGDDGIETLALDVKWNWEEEVMNIIFPPAANVWKNLRKLHMTDSDGMDRLLGHLYANGYVGGDTFLNFVFYLFILFFLSFFTPYLPALLIFSYCERLTHIVLENVRIAGIMDFVSALPYASCKENEQKALLMCGLDNLDESVEPDWKEEEQEREESPLHIRINPFEDPDDPNEVGAMINSRRRL